MRLDMDALRLSYNLKSIEGSLSDFGNAVDRLYMGYVKPVIDASRKGLKVSRASEPNDSFQRDFDHLRNLRTLLIKNAIEQALGEPSDPPSDPD